MVLYQSFVVFPENWFPGNAVTKLSGCSPLSGHTLTHGRPALPLESQPSPKPEASPKWKIWSIVQWRWQLTEWTGKYRKKERIVLHTHTHTQMNKPLAKNLHTHNASKFWVLIRLLFYFHYFQAPMISFFLHATPLIITFSLRGRQHKWLVLWSLQGWTTTQRAAPVTKTTPGPTGGLRIVHPPL